MPRKDNEIVGKNDYCEIRADGSMSVKDLKDHWSGEVGTILGATGAAKCVFEMIQLLAQGSSNQSIQVGTIVGASGILIGMALIVYGQKKDTKKQAGFDRHLMSLVREKEAKLQRELTVQEKLQIGTTVFDM